MGDGSQEQGDTGLRVKGEKKALENCLLGSLGWMKPALMERL